MLAWIPLLLIGLASTPLLGQDRPPNGDFEDGTVGQPPPSWTVPTPDGFQAAITDQGCIEGVQCAVITGSADIAPGSIGVLRTSVDGARYLLRRIRLRAAVRVESGSSAQMWLRVDTATGGRSFLENMSDRPIRTTQWAYYTIDAPVAADTSAVVFGVFLSTPGKVWFDDVTIEIQGEIRSEPSERASPLTDAGLENLVAFTKLAGYVRYFHPSDQAAVADWETFLIDGVRQAEGASSSQELASVLEEMFTPVAPTVRVHMTGDDPPPAPELSRNTENAIRVTRWFHTGLGIATAGGVYSSIRRTAAIFNNQLPADYGDPATTYNAALARGVSARVATTLYADNSGTLPHQNSVASTDIWDRTVDDRATRLANVIITWNVFQHFYPHMDITEVDMPGELRRALRSAAEDTDATDFLVTMRKLVAAMRDGHGIVVDSGTAVSTVPLVWAWVENGLSVVRVKDPQGQGVQPGEISFLSRERQPAQAKEDQSSHSTSAEPALTTP
ncbi:MAG: hypothetical protein GY953_04730, partial [bacterium]|nr:hypothetical protein [bacterium]